LARFAARLIKATYMWRIISDNIAFAVNTLFWLPSA
jgi:hypothetical protein